MERCQAGRHVYELQVDFGCTVLLGREVELVGLGPVCSTFLFEVDLQQKCGVLLQPEAWGFFVTSSVASGGSVGGDL